MKKLSRLLAVFLLSIAISACGTAEGSRQGGGESQTGPQAEASAESAAGEAAEGSEQGSGESQAEASEESAAGGTAGETEDASGDQESLLENEGSGESLPEDGTYTTKDDVALYIHLYGKLPSNFITKKEAEKLGWEGGSLEPYAPGKCIGGSRFGNYEGLLPEAEGRVYTECDIDTLGAQKRGARRIVFSNDGLIYYTEDHYESFELLYGEE